MTLLKNHIELNRSFHELSIDSNVSDDVELNRQFGRIDTLHWPDLLIEHRVILLSEAGAGKTQEIRNTCQNLRSSGKPSFFLRIENMCLSFESSFEEGSFEEFKKWTISGEKGWLFLDSVDEARLKDPKDFERAIRLLGLKLYTVLQNSHIVITGRTSAWRALTDLNLCKSVFPYKVADAIEETNQSVDSTEPVNINIAKELSIKEGSFKIVSLDDLHGSQIDAFLHGKKVEDANAFRDAVDRKDAWELTTRPQDLNELIQFWEVEKRIGSRLELMRSSVSRRLLEHDQDRSEAKPISVEKLRYGTRLVAAATTLTQQSAIRVPDGSENLNGIPIKEVLQDWDDTSCQTLLSRPIFDQGIYGTVRFHHRSVREYLTAEWLHTLIVDDGSRSKIENFFFRSQYGIDVIVPTMRPILSWLAILDSRILARVIKIAPEVIFEGGDPSHLPLEVRVNLLRQTCEQLKNPAHVRTLTDYSSIQRFANIDLAEEIKALLTQYSNDDGVTWYLLRMVWRADIITLAEDVKHFALNSKFKKTRIAAFDALSIVGSIKDKEQVRQAFLSEKGQINREWLAELITDLPFDEDSIKWVLQAIEKSTLKKQFEVDNLTNEIDKYASNLIPPLLKKFIQGLNQLIVKPPFIERGHCDASNQFCWLMPTAAASLLRLIKDKDNGVFELEALELLCLLPCANVYSEQEFHSFIKQLSELIEQWPELGYQIFWSEVPRSRAYIFNLNGTKLINSWQVGGHGHLWNFGINDFDRFCDDITNREFVDDKLLALNLAYSLYRMNGKPRAKLNKLKKICDKNIELMESLDSLLHPKPIELKEFRKQEAIWKKQASRRALKLKEEELQSKNWLDSHISELDTSSKPGTINNAQYYLHRRIKGNDDTSNSWSSGNWKSLINEFGEEIAKGFRNGSVKFWRGYKPKLLSEGAIKNTTPFEVIFGLTGLAIEAREEPEWLKQINKSNAETAVRFALNELNGFPTWLPQLFSIFPDVVIDLIIQEIEFELKNNNAEQESQYVLADVSWGGEWLWDSLAPVLLKLANKSQKNIKHLRHMLKIIAGSKVDSEAIAKLAAKNTAGVKNLPSTSLWFSMWVGTDPGKAIPVFEDRLASMDSDEDRTTFAMQFITSLIGGRGESNVSRLAYRSVKHMKSLYLLMHKYIREQDDLDRANRGVYSPGLRDDAQDARNALISFIRETSGKEAYLALKEIASAHASEKAKPWMALYAKDKATLDSQVAPWLPNQVYDFNNAIERTPSNHKDLWYLAIQKLTDFKFDLEDGDSSPASIIQKTDREVEIRKYIGNWCRERAKGRYIIPQEEELADGKKPDFRFHGVGFDGPVPTELKIADNWKGTQLFERLENQLCRDYLRDVRSSRGIYLLVYRGESLDWTLPNSSKVKFDDLIIALQNHWTTLSSQFPNIEDISIIGVDLTKRGSRIIAPSKKKSNPPLKVSV